MIPSPINFPPIANLQNQNRQQLVLNIANDAIIAYAIAPKVAQSSLQRFAQGARIVATSHALVQKIENSPGRGLVDFSQLLLCGLRVLNRPSQGLS